MTDNVVARLWEVEQCVATYPYTASRIIDEIAADCVGQPKLAASFIDSAFDFAQPVAALSAYVACDLAAAMLRVVPDPQREACIAKIRPRFSSSFKKLVAAGIEHPMLAL